MEATACPDRAATRFFGSFVVWRACASEFIVAKRTPLAASKDAHAGV
jgi:hypothetical protein